MRESVIVRHTCSAAKASGWRHYKWVSPGMRGVPDNFFTKSVRRIIFIEFKKADGESRTQQLKRQQELRDQGFDVYEVFSVEQGRAIFSCDV